MYLNQFLVAGCKVRYPAGEASVQLDADPAAAGGGGARGTPRHAQGAAGQDNEPVLDYSILQCHIRSGFSVVLAFETLPSKSPTTFILYIFNQEP